MSGDKLIFTKGSHCNIAQLTTRMLEVLFTWQTSHAGVQADRLPGDQCFLTLSSVHHNICHDTKHPSEKDISILNCDSKYICTCPWKDGAILSDINKRTAVLAMSWLESCPLIPSVTVCLTGSPYIMRPRLLVSMLTCSMVGEVTSMTMAACIMPERVTTWSLLIPEK